MSDATETNGRKNTRLTHAQVLRIADFMRAAESAVLRQALPDVARAATAAVGFEVVVSSVQTIAAAIGREVGPVSAGELMERIEMLEREVARDRADIDLGSRTLASVLLAYDEYRDALGHGQDGCVAAEALAGAISAAADPMLVEAEG